MVNTPQSVDRVLDVGFGFGDTKESLAELVGSERPGPGGWRVAGYELRLRDGLRFAADLDPDAVAIIRALDGRSTLGDLGLGVDERRLVRRLTELGFAEVV